MTNFITPRSTLLALAFAAVSGIGIASLSTSASATNLLDACHSKTRLGVISCCEHYIKANGRPIWMDEARASCAAAVVCVKAPEPITRSLTETSIITNKPLCWVKPPVFTDGGSINQIQPPTNYFSGGNIIG